MDASCNCPIVPAIKRQIGLADLQKRCNLEVTHETCYQQFSDMGFCYGPNFQTIERLWLGKGEALGRIHVPASQANELTTYQLHPVVLDACFQMLLPFASPEGEEAGGTSLPVGVDHIHIFGPATTDMWCYATLVKRTTEQTDGNIVLCDDEGNILVEVHGFRVQSLENTKPPFSSSQQADTWLYEPRWLPLPMEPNEESASEDPGRWLIFADKSGVGEQISARLEAKGQQCTLVVPGRGYRRSGSNAYTIGATAPDDYKRLLAEVFEHDAFPCRGIIHLWSLNAHPETEITTKFLEEVQDITTFSIMYLVQALAQTNQSPRLWLLTRGAQSVGVETALPSIAQAPLWGLGRVMYEEFITLHTTLIDLDPVSSGDDVEALFNGIWQPDEENQIVWRNGERYVLRLEHMHTSEQTLPPYFHPDGSYLITGGLGALGQLVANWMVEHGARHLILMGRTALPPRSEWHSLPKDHPAAAQVAFLHDLEVRGTSVHLAAVDVTDEEALTAFLKQYEQDGWPPIRGVVHSAGVVKDQILWNMDKETFNVVLRPKMLGSWVLHHCLRDAPLDFFVLFSSIADLVVFTGQSNYSAGNAFVDALTHYRRIQGLPSLAINWGPWKVGMIAQLDLEEMYKQRGIEIIHPEQGIYLLTHLFSNPAQQVAVISADWLQVFENYNVIPPLIRQLGVSENDGTGSDQAEESLMEKIAHAESAERQALVESYLKETVARVLHLEQSRLDSEQALNTLGMDSMMAVELKNRIEQGLPISFSVVELLQGASVVQLAALVTARLPLTDIDAEEVTADDLENLSEQVDEETLAQLLQQVEHLSQDELKEQMTVVNH